MQNVEKQKKKRNFQSINFWSENKSITFFRQILYGVTPGVSLDVNGSISELIKEEEFENFWIQCDICTLWYHGRYQF